MRNHRSRAFTLIELLVVIAIIAILAAILFPVFAQAKSAAQKTVDITRFKQVGTAAAMYLGDSDGVYMLSNSGYLNAPGWGYGPPDTVPGQALMPYSKNTMIYTSPMDPYNEEARVDYYLKCCANGTNIARTRAALTPLQKQYILMVTSNMGYNYAFLSPWVARPQDGKTYVGSVSVSESEMNGTATTLMFASSLWYRNEKSGGPEGGGNWVIETPCWEDSAGNTLRPMGPLEAAGILRAYTGGWYPPTNPPGPTAWLVYGGVWPWHNQVDLGKTQPGLKDGQVITTMADTSTKARNIKQLIEGCTAYGTASRKGKVTDTTKFLWDLD